MPFSVRKTPLLHVFGEHGCLHHAAISSLGISDEPLFCCFVFHQFCIEDSPKLAANYPENIYVHNLLEICIRLSLAETPQNVLKKVCQHKWQSI